MPVCILRVVVVLGELPFYLLPAHLPLNNWVVMIWRSSMENMEINDAGSSRHIVEVLFLKLSYTLVPVETSNLFPCFYLFMLCHVLLVTST